MKEIIEPDKRFATTKNDKKVSLLRAQLAGVPMCISPVYFQALLEVTEIGDIPKMSYVPSGKHIKDTYNVQRVGSTAIVPITGPLSPRASFFSMIFGETTYDTLIEDLHTISTMKSIKNVVLDVDSPGGAVTGVHEAEQAVHELKQHKGVVAYTSGTNCSAAYWISSAAEHVFASPTADIGSIGAIAYVPKDEDDEDVYVSSHAKNKNKPKKWMQSVLDDIESVFRTSVMYNRDVTEKFVNDNWGDGSVFSAKEAVANKMIDAIVPMTEII